LVDFTDSLVDAAMLHKIQTTDKKHIFVIAGWWHTNNIVEQLSAQQYQMFNQQGLTYKEFNKRIDSPGDRRTFRSEIPALDIKHYFAQTNSKMQRRAVTDYVNEFTSFRPDLGFTRFAQATIPGSAWLPWNRLML
jgi:hypothetical protein